MHRSIITGLTVFAVAATGALAEDRAVTDEDLAYPGTIVIADGHGKVDVRVIYQAHEDCWRIASARQGMPNPAVDQPTDRHLYVTVAIGCRRCEQGQIGLCAGPLTVVKARRWHPAQNPSAISQPPSLPQ